MRSVTSLGANIGEKICQWEVFCLNGRIIVDCHTHTRFSHDSNCEPSDSFAAAKEKKLTHFAVTDHCDIEFCDIIDVKTPVLNSVNTAKSYNGYALSGVEIGEALWNTDAAEDVLQSAGFDIVLGSVHAVRYGENQIPFARLDFSRFGETEIGEFMETYFNDVLETAVKCDYDVLTHLTNPLKYITGKYAIRVDLSKYAAIIDEILKTIIKKDRALEVNTACLDTAYDELMPELPIIARYKELGGFLITLASDAHSADRIAHGFERTAAQLKNIGFDKLCYFKKRKPILYDI